ncbi:hypothetical protein CPLU01_12863 [Colletotrichum plurivorum]|uniref:Uncharacterized protein n=1 Tax=Colletotrichum plurivorum TaxID=2175906 RepID=A0A8H6JVE3_9PEZI|nr:hypothetical protein CPLU01_12863 [Colletotrichum plurivorum]
MDEPHTYSQEEQAPQITQIRKRQSDDEPLIKRARLTRENLARLNKMGKPKKGSKTASTERETTDDSTTTKSISTTASVFATQARDNGMLDPFGSKTPTNHEARRERSARSRETASPTETEDMNYVKRIAGADNEMTMVYEAGTRLLKEYDDDGCKKIFIEGLEAEEFRPFPVGNHITGAVLYKNNPRSVTLPHLAGEWKGPDGSASEATLQSAYDGTALAHARNQALSYLEKPDPPGHAEITTFTTDGKILNFYSHHAARTEDETLEYHQHPEASYNLMKFDEYKDGRRHPRNTQDRAKELSYALRDQLKEHWKQQRGTLLPIAQGTPSPAPIPELTNAYEETTQREDQASYEVVGQPCQPTSAASTKPHKTPTSHSSRTSHSSSNDSRKRKAAPSQSSSQGSPGHASKHRNYWKKDPNTGGYYHKHSDGTISWLGTEE